MRRKYWPDFKSKRAVKELLIMRPFHFCAFKPICKQVCCCPLLLSRAIFSNPIQCGSNFTGPHANFTSSALRFTNAMKPIIILQSLQPGGRQSTGNRATVGNGAGCCAQHRRLFAAKMAQYPLCTNTSMHDDSFWEIVPQ